MKLRFIPYFLLQCTWGIIQTFVGFVMFCYSIKERHKFYNGAIATYWKKPYGISLGAFIFIPPKARFYNSVKYHFSDDEIQDRLLVHEYGHTIQSLFLGPLYFLIIGIPSVIWGAAKKKLTNLIFPSIQKNRQIVWANIVPVINPWKCSTYNKYHSDLTAYLNQ